jgi:hypothetical protein
MAGMIHSQDTEMTEIMDIIMEDMGIHKMGA